MRALLIVLVMTNIAYFGWNNYFRPELVAPVTRAGPVSTKLPGLTLLGEEQVGIVDHSRASMAIEGGGQMLIGGFLDRETANALRQRMLGLGVDGRVTQQDKPAEQEYWVYLPPLSSRAATLRLLKELQARKLDGFLIAQGELANGISLGIFPHENSAEAILERLRQGGYQAQIKRISRKQTVYWFEVSQGGERLVDEGTLQLLLKDFPGLQYTQSLVTGG